uniref:Uncharacterized protein n=1 Tax=Chromera velia CCMP2878 TaxID=1169474 RepID=A0A0G4G841_9ALVE|eukprot:Cvel_4313.t1-p1 / transcript=Cvel_4313.t1 / gene=Cvel_4313 / organism=Chromera_velia_CCMP2878 / gene_product=hypothetical protein / transcript_product=hypothetical protein / location=Cvel_scaffold187:23986-24603(+) / protein_length=206 / sequence_SO=supercontig / SO=protein_coding / is_pseudo=false
MKRTHEYLGCSFPELKAHLEKDNFDGNPGMSWENYGSLWHVDHIVPIMFAGADGQKPDRDTLVSRLHYSNLQPLWSGDNLRKGNRFVGKPPPLLPLPQQVRSVSRLPGQVDIKEPPCVPKTPSTVWEVGSTRLSHSWLALTAWWNHNDRLFRERALGVRVGRGLRSANRIPGFRMQARSLSAVFSHTPPIHTEFRHDVPLANACHP